MTNVRKVITAAVPAAFAAVQPLVYNTTLANPNQWAFVNASGGCHWPDCDSSNVPQIQCQIAVDGQVVVTQSATTGVTCSTRPWPPTGPQTQRRTRRPRQDAR